MTSQRLDIRLLKQFAAERLPTESALRQVLLVEEDKIPISEFVCKSSLWLKLLKRGERRRGEGSS